MALSCGACELTKQIPFGRRPGESLFPFPRRNENKTTQLFPSHCFPFLLLQQPSVCQNTVHLLSDLNSLFRCRRMNLKIVTSFTPFVWPRFRAEVSGVCVLCIQEKMCRADFLLPCPPYSLSNGIQRILKFMIFCVQCLDFWLTFKLRPIPSRTSRRCSKRVRAFLAPISFSPVLDETEEYYAISAKSTCFFGPPNVFCISVLSW